MLKCFGSFFKNMPGRGQGGLDLCRLTVSLPISSCWSIRVALYGILYGMLYIISCFSLIGRLECSKSLPLSESCCLRAH